MRKYVNGKILEITEEDIAKRNRRFGDRTKSRNNTSEYEKRVKELETVVAELQAKLNEIKNV